MNPAFNYHLCENVTSRMRKPSFLGYPDVEDCKVILAFELLWNSQTEAFPPRAGQRGTAKQACLRTQEAKKVSTSL
ncbi:rCG62382 [Rattus norvegicus]|uniref:RCG62382 n=1 Tax=Rattus norvegicus TaxID=10116 RepID=A6HC25_RAT|nr:rCG62382 [Rattus norvegicus]